MMMRTYWI